MNTANPQLEGLYLALAAINRLLVEKQLVTHEEIHRVLKDAENTVLSDPQPATVSHAHTKAVAFPIRFLMLANDTSAKGGSVDFETLARQVGLDH